MIRLRKKFSGKGVWIHIPESEYNQKIRQELAPIFKYEVEDEQGETVDYLPTWHERYLYDNSRSEAVQFTLHGNTYRLVEVEKMNAYQITQVSKFYTWTSTKQDRLDLENQTVIDRLSVREFPHIIVPAQFWQADVEDFVDNMIGLDPAKKATIATQFSWWKDENEQLVPKPQVLPEPDGWPRETTPTIEEYNKFAGLLASGEVKSVGINELFQLKADPESKCYVVGLSPLSIVNGQLRAVMDIAANYPVPFFTVVLRGIEVLEWLEPSAT